MFDACGLMLRRNGFSFPSTTGGPCLSKASRGLTGWGAPPPLRRSAEKASRRACARLGPSLMVTSDVATHRSIVSAQHAPQ